MNYGADYGKLVVIVDIVDTKRVLIDSADRSMPRCIYPLRRLSLTKIKVDKVHRGCRTGTLVKKTKKDDIVSKFKATPVSIKQEKYKLRSSLSDFDRFKAMVLKKQRSYQRGHLDAKKKAAPAKGGDKKAAGKAPAAKGGEKKKGKK